MSTPAKAVKPIMGDLFCGRGGWTKGFQAQGWDCWGIDLNPQPLYPGRFIQADIAQLVELPHADFYCCSSPCEGFSVHNMKHFHPNPKWPWLGSALLDYSRYLLEQTGKPYIVENVRAAEKFMGKAVQHCGPFYFWGNGVPAVFPRDAYRVTKGMNITQAWDRDTGKRSYAGPRRFSSGSQQRRDEVAKLAEIPHKLASYLAETAVNW